MHQSVYAGYDLVNTVQCVVAHVFVYLHDRGFAPPARYRAAIYCSILAYLLVLEMYLLGI